MTGGPEQGAEPRTEFPRRLSSAIAASGMSLSRIQSELDSRGMSVSVATLSYWSNGRSLPARSNSRKMVGELEEILGLQCGHLTDLLQQSTPTPFHWSVDRIEAVRRLVEDEGLVTATGQQLLMAHMETTIGADRVQKYTTTTMVTRARTDTARGWSVSLDDDGQPGARAEAIAGLKPGRIFPVDEHLTLFEFLFDPPLARGECRRTVHRSSFENQEASVSVGYSISRPTDLFILSISFEGEIPSSCTRTFTPPGPSTDGAIVCEMTPRKLLEVVIPTPPMGHHDIQWEW